MRMGDRTLTVRRATEGQRQQAEQKQQDMYVGNTARVVKLSHAGGLVGWVGSWGWRGRRLPACRLRPWAAAAAGYVCPAFGAQLVFSVACQWLPVACSQPPAALTPPARPPCRAVTLEELGDDQEYGDIMEDMKEECGKYGTVVQVRRVGVEWWRAGAGQGCRARGGPWCSALGILTDWLS